MPDQTHTIWQGDIRPNTDIFVRDIRPNHITFGEGFWARWNVQLVTLNINVPTPQLVEEEVDEQIKEHSILFIIDTWTMYLFMIFVIMSSHATDGFILKVILILRWTLLSAIVGRLFTIGKYAKIFLLLRAQGN